MSYWLQSINAKAKGAPIICVGTKQDLCSPSQINETFLKMQDQFSSFGVKEFMPVSCISGKGIKELKMVIMKAALKQRTMGEQIPKIYLELERMVERKRVELAYLKKPPTVYFEEFRVMAMNIPKLEDEVGTHAATNTCTARITRTIVAATHTYLSFAFYRRS